MENIRRLTSLETDPVPGKVTDYSPSDSARLASEVLRVSGNGMFVSRVLRVITRNGRSKHFEMLTGQDGLTFGITDFASGSVNSFFKAAATAYPADFESAFGRDSNLLLDSSWVSRENGGKQEYDNKGLIRYSWVRKGLADILASPHFRGLQLAHFVDGKVTPSHRLFISTGLAAEWTLAVMIGIANSFGASGMRDKFLRKATEKADAKHLSGAAKEMFIACDMAERYIDRDVKAEPNARKILSCIRDPSVQIPQSDSGLGHRGRRMWEILREFPNRTEPFTVIGKFALSADETWSGNPTTS